MSLRFFKCLICSIGIWLSLTSAAFACRQPEVISYVGSMNQAQQAYYLKKNTFAQNLNELGVGVPEQTEYYLYKTVMTPHGVLNFGTAINNQLGSDVSCQWRCDEGIRWPCADNPNKCGDSDSNYLFCTSRIESCRGANYVGAVYLKQINNKFTTLDLLGNKSKAQR
ncbi:type IV pilin-like G/H family protein [Pseudanabaena sp. UWO310]|uniref:type IV pilin-like G/H family protein n=1 Tax=Pseudanabaena sp. UWO310 TaxID=2480795 RepID=UPI0011614133|nr:type IV pilin-like G/H family protein [Pseudanabaena sp. UWO310]TYQ23467.1 hypothetical protein PseudUWO310_22230 [Pseudanabaena sp. UWO310]